MLAVLLVLQILLLQQRYTWSRVTSSNDVMGVQVRDSSNGNNNRLTCGDDNEVKLNENTSIDIEMV